MDEIDSLSQSTEIRITIQPQAREGVRDNTDEALNLMSQSPMDFAEELAADTAETDE